jgi:hypothetical protein
LDRHRVVIAVATALLLVSVAGCGGSSASPSAAASVAPSEAPVPTDAPSAVPSGVAASPTPAVRTTATALCGGIAMRKQPKAAADVLVRTKAGQKVRIVEVVMGDAYTAGSCGMSGNSWLKVDRIGGKSVKTLYGVPFGYVAAGFFQ